MLRNPDSQIGIDQQDYDEDGNPKQRPTVEEARATDADPNPTPGPAPAPGDDSGSPGTPDPVVQSGPAAPAPADTFQPSDIAGKVVDAQTPAQPAAASLPADQDPDVLALMRARYQSDPDQVARQRAAAAGGPALDGGAGNLAAGNAPLSMEQILQNRLIELMGRNATPSESDPEIAKTLQATRLAGQRAFDRNAAELAERASYAGQSGSGAAEAGRAALRQAQGETEQQITAKTFTDAANRRIAELQQTLQTAGSLLDAKQQRAVQLQIAQLQDATDRAQIGEGGRQFDSSLAEKIREYGLDADARAAALAASGSASGGALDERRYEFDQNLGWDKERYTTDSNQNSVLAILKYTNPELFPAE
jgi:hypothetical protein